MEYEACQYGNDLLDQFFPTTDGRGFYTDFYPNERAMTVEPVTPLGVAMLGVVGLVCKDDGTFGPSDPACDVKPGGITLLRMDDAFFVGYWDGDGVAVVGRAKDAFWADSSDVKDPSWWREVHADAALSELLLQK